MKSRYIIILLLALSFLTKAQLYKPVEFPENINDKYTIKTIEEYNKYKNRMKKKLPKKYLDEYLYSTVFGKSGMFEQGEIYFGWDEVETYVNQILEQILPSNLQKKKIRAYIGRSSAINAYCLYDGTMIVNIGLIAEVKNEAALASIMGHELAHYIKNHIEKGYRNSVSTKKKKSKKGEDLEFDLSTKKFSQKMELEADQVGFEIVSSAGYDVREGISNYELIIRENEYFSKRNKSELANTDTVELITKKGLIKVNSLEKLLSTHPDLKERIGKLNEFVASNKQDANKTYKVSQDKLLMIQKKAQLESIHLLFSNHQYEECLERAFIMYLYNPENSAMHYYIEESIRRLCLLNYKLRKEGFLAEKLTKSGFKKGESILHDIKYLVPNNFNYNRIKAKYLFEGNDYAFETYKEAFYFFTGLLIKANEPEAFLSRALFENNQAKRQLNIKEYLASGKAKRKDFAIAYRDNKLNDAIKENQAEIAMVPKVDFFSHLDINAYYPFGFGQTKYLFGKSETKGKEMANSFARKISGHKKINVRAISLPDASTTNFNTKFKYENVLYATFLASREENEGYKVVHYYKELEDEDYIGRIDIFRLEPNVWEFFRNEKINTLTYAQFTRHKSRAVNRTLIITLICGIPTFGVSAAYGLAFIRPNSKKTTIFSFNPAFGAVYYDYRFGVRKLMPMGALRHFKKLRRKRNKIIEDYGVSSNSLAASNQ
ncbi:MAG: M48 family metallopeptidase [Bacteroidia bacterium]